MTTGAGLRGDLEGESVGGGELEGEWEGEGKSRGGGGKMEARAMLKEGVEDLDSPAATSGDSEGEGEGIGERLLMVPEELRLLDSLALGV